MNIPDEAVEAAANIIRERDYPDYSPDLDFARRVLRVAAPHLMAQAWDEGIEAGSDEGIPECDYARNPYRSEASPDSRAMPPQPKTEPAPWPAGLRARLIATGWLKGE